MSLIRFCNMERLSIECRKTKTSVITAVDHRKSFRESPKSQWELGVETTQLPEERENTGDHVIIGYRFALDWLREWREFLDQ